MALVAIYVDLNIGYRVFIDGCQGKEVVLVRHSVWMAAATNYINMNAFFLELRDTLNYQA
jgi:hypothetical protein